MTLIAQKETLKAAARFELTISCLLDRRFNQLSHAALPCCEIKQMPTVGSLMSWSFLDSAAYLVAEQLLNPLIGILLLLDFYKKSCRVFKNVLRKIWQKFQIQSYQEIYS